MLKSVHPAIKITASIVLLIVILIAGHEIIEAKIFHALTNQPGMQIHIGSKSGNLFSGYTLRDLSVTQKIARGDAPPETFSTSRVTVHWSLNPFQLTELSWDIGSYKITPSDSDPVEIPVGGANLKPDASGWLVPDGKIVVGESDWDGNMNLKIRVDIKELNGKITIRRLPGRLINIMGDPPEGFAVPSHANLDLDFSGNPSAIKVSGTVSDPLTRRSFRF